MKHMHDPIGSEARSSQRLQSKRNLSKSGTVVEPMPQEGFDFKECHLLDDSTIPMDKFEFNRDPKADFPHHYLAAALVLFYKQSNPSMEQAYQDFKWKWEKHTSETFENMVQGLTNGLPPVSPQRTDEAYSWITDNAKLLAAGAASNKEAGLE